MVCRFGKFGISIVVEKGISFGVLAFCGIPVLLCGSQLGRRGLFRSLCRSGLLDDLELP